MYENNFLLLIVDPQNDFCDPDGALYVPGAEDDMLRLSHFIRENMDDISQIIVTRDEHQVIDISHPGFWSDSVGNMPQFFTAITHQDVVDKKWVPVFMREEVLDYLLTLKNNEEMQHVVWPEHCLAGSWGAAFNDDVMDAVADWSRAGRFYTVVSKGQNPLTEHFGAIRANVMLEDDPSTQINYRLVNELAGASAIVIAGEAQSHCVANTLKQILEQPEIQGRIFVLTDCMSHVPGFEDAARDIFHQAEARGVIFCTSESFLTQIN